MSFHDEQLVQLQNRVQAEQVNIDNDPLATKKFNDLNECFNEAVEDKNTKTISIDYNGDIHQSSIQIIKDNLQVCNYYKYKFNESEEIFNNFCEKVLHLDLNQRFNASTNTIINGVFARVFAIMPPYRKHPLIVISTVKEPPNSIQTLTAAEEKILKYLIRHKNVLIAGKTGSGKTYLLNYLLKKYGNNDKRIGIIQEFREIISPNKFTDQIDVPPRKPDQKYCDLEFLTEQTNLMRYDLVIIGEIKGPEAWPFVINSASGIQHISTIHGIDEQSVLSRLKTLCLLARENLSDEVVTNFISKAIDAVVLVEDGKVKSIQKVLLANKKAGTFSLEPYDADDLPEDEEEKEERIRQQARERLQEQAQQQQPVYSNQDYNQQQYVDPQQQQQQYVDPSMYNQQYGDPNNQQQNWG